MYCIGRVGDLPQWKDPTTGAIVRSKDARRLEMQPGQNYRHVCNLPISCPGKVLACAAVAADQTKVYFRHSRLTRNPFYRLAALAPSL